VDDAEFVIGPVHPGRHGGYGQECLPERRATSQADLRPRAEEKASVKLQGASDINNNLDG